MASGISRHYIDVGSHRVHYQRAGHGPAVVLLHESPRSSSSALLPLMQQAPAGVTVLALDTPGNGLSDPLPHTAPTAFDYGDALALTLTALGIKRAAVYGRHSGAAFACALALRHPQRVSRLVLDGVSAFTAAEQAQWLPAYLPNFVPLPDGSHMAWLWSRVRDQALFFPWHEARVAHRLWRPLPTPAALQAVALDLLLAGDAYRAPYRAAFTFDPLPVLPLLQMPTEVGARENDVLRPHQARLPRLPSHVHVREMPNDSAVVAAQVWQWLHAGAQGLNEAPPAQDAALPAARLGDTLAGAAGQRTHLRGATGGSGRPQVWLHPSPGGARGMDRQLQRSLLQCPVLALDLPNHGESDAGPSEPEALLDELQALLCTLGLDDAELCGEGLGAAVAAALARRRPAISQLRDSPHIPVGLGFDRLSPNGFRCTAPTPSSAAGASSSPPDPCTPRADGGHLLAAWLHARDEAVLGGWWHRAEQPHLDCGDTLDLDTVQARALEYLKEADAAASVRAAWQQRMGI